MRNLATLDQRYVWHPFTQMRDWLKGDPIVIVRGSGAQLQDASGRKYLDANSSIWTNLHGHNHPQINRAIRAQLGKIAHSSALGLANEPASVLAQKLIREANLSMNLNVAASRQNAAIFETESVRRSTETPLRFRGSKGELVQGILSSSPTSGPAAKTGLSTSEPGLSKVFFSDNGSTALEVALKLSFEYSRRTGLTKHPRFLGLQGGYHGDTIGAVSLGHIDLFHHAYAPLLFKTDQVMAPYCYRCPFNRAKPERADARQYRKCNWECIGQIERKFVAQSRKGNSYAAFVVEPLMQGAAGMIPQPAGWLKRACQIARGSGALIIADEVMTGFGRTGHESSEASSKAEPTVGVFACQKEGVEPDFLALAKGLTGGYVPMAATLTTQAVFDTFLGEYDEFKTFFHGHSFTGNQIGAAAALASLTLLRSSESRRRRRGLEQVLAAELQQLWRSPQVGDLRQVGLVVGVELVKDWRTRRPYDLRDRAGIRVCEAMARRGVLTRPVGNVIVLMPPYCTTDDQASQMVTVLSQSIDEVLGAKTASKRS